MLTLKALHDQRFEAMDAALRLQTAELSRRLDALNHAHAQAVEVQATYLPREMFDEFVKAFNEYKTVTNRALVLREGREAGVGASWTVLLSVSALALAAGSLLVRVLAG